MPALAPCPGPGPRRHGGHRPPNRGQTPPSQRLPVSPDCSNIQVTHPRPIPLPTTAKTFYECNSCLPQERSHTFHQSGPSSYLNGKYRSQRPPDKIAQRRARRPQHSRCSDYWEKPRLYQTSGGLAIVHYPESTKYSSVYPRSPNWGVWNSVHNESPGMPSVSSRGKSPANTHSSKSLPDMVALYCPHVVTAGHSGTFWRGIPSLRHGLGDLVPVRLGPRSLGHLH